MAKNEAVKMLTASTALRVVDIADIGFDKSYQRVVVPKHKQIVTAFNPNALGVPLVAQRDDGSLWCVDGRQRITALGKLGKKTVRAEVFVSTGPEHEAEVFRLVNGGRTPLQPGELFRSKLTAGDASAWEIKRAVEAAGYKLILDRGRTGGGKGPEAWKEVRAVRTLIDIYKAAHDRENRGANITRALVACAKAWPGDGMAACADIIGGVGQFLGRVGDAADDDRLADRLGTTTPQKLLYTASLGIGGRIANVADVVARLYAKRAQKNADRKA